MVESNSQNKKKASVGQTGMYGFDERDDNLPQKDFENSQPQSQIQHPPTRTVHKVGSANTMENIQIESNQFVKIQEHRNIQNFNETFQQKKLKWSIEFNSLTDFQYKYEPAQESGLNSNLIQVRILHQEALYEKDPRDDYYSEIYHNYRRKDDDLEGEDMNDILKFIKQKYFMFSRYDMGICLDKVGWFSLTPEPVAAFMASFVEDINKAIVVDCCCGVGGNIIQFARLSNVEQCYAIDLDKQRNKFARSNANKYEVGKKISFQQGDFLELKVEKYFQDKPDSVVFFFDPPWGGLDYREHEKFQIKDFLPYNFQESLCKAFKYSVNIILKLPSNMDLDELYETIVQCYCTTRNQYISGDGSEQLNIQTMIIKTKYKLKYYMVLIGNQLTRKDLTKMSKNFSLPKHRKVEEVNQKQKAESPKQSIPIPKKVTKVQNEQLGDDDYGVEHFKTSKKKK
eukprot:403363306